MERILAIVSGRVQGVGFRWATLEKAEALGLSGSVRNEPDGTVRVEIEGVRADELLAWLHDGPAYAWVSSVAVSALPALGEDGFRVG
ncbi:acylphosphatase [Glaciihabitans arcticus]|uniref:acylphosphatase n=1 Tax=Glaciihabitans arcticus TaxID=2668039 RepID=A0A4Q9GSP8_9MICO|nr:acylphosphatase [Glaciihabitans arcticus]TBN56638.1 acylphosphatase [Glaciihabitans arcticus]